MTSHVAGGLIQGYRVIRTLGRGGLATTYEATREATGERVALKRLAIAQASEWKRIELFEREALVLSRLQHPGIPRYIEHFTVEGDQGPSLYIAQELVLGTSLAEVVRAGGASLDEQEVRRIAVEILGILSYLEQQTPPVVHRDIKPENVLRRPDGSIALVDFGAARADASRPEGGSTTVGTYGYMAPEQLHGVATPATDLYGLGCTLLYLLTGRSPTDLPRRKLHVDFEPAVRGRASEPFVAWLGKALEPAAEDRFASAAFALAALRGLPGGGGAPVDFGPPKQPRVRPLTWALLGTLLLVVTGAGAFALREWAQGVATPVTRSPTRQPGELPSRWEQPVAARGVRITRWWAGHLSAVFSVAVSPEGDRVASSSNDGTVKIWDLKTGEPVRALAGHSARVRQVVWSHDGSLVASAGDSTVLVHDTAKGAIRLKLDLPGADAVDVSPDGKTIAAGSTAGTVQVWSLDAGALLHTLPQVGVVDSVQFSPDGQWLATAGKDKQVHIYTVATGAQRTALVGHTAEVDSVAWAPDGRVLASVADDHTFRLWIATDGHPLEGRTFETNNELWSLAIDPKGKYAATTGKDGVLRVYDIMKWKLVASRLLEKTGVLSVAWAPDGKTLVAGDGAARIDVLSVDFESHADRVPPLPPETRPSAKSPTPSEELYDRVSTMGLTWAGRQAELAEAERLVDEALKKEPDDPFLLLGMARVKLHKGFLHGNEYTPASLDEADGLLTRVLAVAPALPEAHVQRGYHLFFRKDEAHAKEEALLALKAGPSTRAHRLLGDLAFHAGDLEEAEKQSLEALALATRRQASYGTLEQVYHQLGDYEAAERCYDRTIEADPTNPYTRASLASMFVDHGLYDRAIEMGESAQKILNYEYGRETLARAHNEKGAEALWTGKDAGLAKAEFEKALTVDPKSAHAHYGLGAYYRKMAVARHDKALLKRSNDELEQAAKLDRDPTLAKAARAENDLLSVR